VGDGLVSQIPALIISLAAGMLVAKGGTRGSADIVVFGQLSHYPNALLLAAFLLLILGVVPGLPFLPFATLAGTMAFVAAAIPRRAARERAREAAESGAREAQAKSDAQASLKEQLKTAEVELCLSKELTAAFAGARDDLGARIAKMRRKFALKYGLVVPDIRISDDIKLPAKIYQVRIHGTVMARHELRTREHLVILEGDRRPNVPGEEMREPAFGMKALSISEAFVNDAKREGFRTIDPLSVLLTHVSEIIHNNLAQLLSYKDMRALLERLEPDYKRLLEEVCPSQISYSSLQAVLKLLLAERVSIRNLGLILEAVAEIAPHARRPEQIAEHARIRIAQQICGDLQEGGTLKVLRLGNRWDLALHQGLRRDAKGEIVEFDIEPRLMEEFAAECAVAIRKRIEDKHQFVIVTTAETRPYVRMIVERMFPTLSVLSQLEIARGIEVRSLGTVS
jgi:flagellar biosynthesis protein FlhA